LDTVLVFLRHQLQTSYLISLLSSTSCVTRFITLEAIFLELSAVDLGIFHKNVIFQGFFFFGLLYNRSSVKLLIENSILFSWSTGKTSHLKLTKYKYWIKSSKIFENNCYSA
jgi:hypothetical protein